MLFIQQLKEHLFEREIKRLLSRKKRVRKFSGFQSAKNIGIYAVYHNDEQFTALINFVRGLRNEGKMVSMLLFIENETIPEYMTEGTHLGYFTEKDIDFKYIPKTTQKAYIRYFIDTEFDILFDLSLAGHHQDIYITAASAAFFKVGKTGKWQTRINDFSLETAGVPPVSETSNTGHEEQKTFIDQILHYIEHIRI